MSRDNGLGKGQTVPRYRRVSLTTGHCGWCQVSIVHGGRVSIKLQATNRVGTTES